MSKSRWDDQFRGTNPNRFDRDNNGKRPAYARDSFGTHEVGKEPADYVAPVIPATPTERPPRHRPGWYAAKHTAENNTSAHVGLYWDGQRWIDPDMKVYSGTILCDPSQTYANGAEALEAAQKFFGSLE